MTAAAKRLSYTLRFPASPGIPPVQACCGKPHRLPFQHRRYYTDRRGRSRYVQECARCMRTLAARGLRWSNIRWQERPGDALCKVCREEVKAQIDATDPGEDIFATVARNNRP